MKPILIFRHIECEGPGYLADFLSRRALPYRIVCVDRGEPVPASPDQAAGLVFMGGPMSVNDDLPWISAELALIDRACASGVPVLGHCLGGQLIAKALGGQVRPSSAKEIGWHEVRRVDPAAAAAVPDLPRRFEAFHWHGETFSIPDGAARLMESDHCPNQAFIKDRALAMQFHIEITGSMVEEWSRLYSKEMQESAGGPAVQSADRLMDDLAAHVAALHRAADPLYRAWAANLPG